MSTSPSMEDLVAALDAFPPSDTSSEKLSDANASDSVLANAKRRMTTLFQHSPRGRRGRRANRWQPAGAIQSSIEAVEPRIVLSATTEAAATEGLVVAEDQNFVLQNQAVQSFELPADTTEINISGEYVSGGKSHDWAQIHLKNADGNSVGLAFMSDGYARFLVMNTNTQQTVEVPVKYTGAFQMQFESGQMRLTGGENDVAIDLGADVQIASVDFIAKYFGHFRGVDVSVGGESETEVAVENEETKEVKQVKEAQETSEKAETTTGKVVIAENETLRLRNGESRTYEIPDSVEAIDIEGVYSVSQKYDWIQVHLLDEAGESVGLAFMSNTYDRFLVMNTKTQETAEVPVRYTGAFHMRFENGILLLEGGGNSVQIDLGAETHVDDVKFLSKHDLTIGKTTIIGEQEVAVTQQEEEEPVTEAEEEAATSENPQTTEQNEGGGGVITVTNETPEELEFILLHEAANGGTVHIASAGDDQWILSESVPVLAQNEVLRNHSEVDRVVALNALKSPATGSQAAFNHTLNVILETDGSEPSWIRALQYIDSQDHQEIAADALQALRAAEAAAQESGDNPFRNLHVTLASLEAGEISALTQQEYETVLFGFAENSANAERALLYILEHGSGLEVPRNVVGFLEDNMEEIEGQLNTPIVTRHAVVTPTTQQIQKFLADNLSDDDLQTTGFHIVSRDDVAYLSSDEIAELFHPISEPTEKLSFGNDIADAIEKTNLFNIPSHLETWDEITNRRILTLHPEFQEHAALFVNTVEQELGIQLRISDYFRTFEQQQKLYDANVSPARAGESYHNYGLAIDVAEIRDGKVNYNLDWNAVGAIGQRLGFTWGNSFGNGDNVHFEMSFGLSTHELLRRLQENNGNISKINLH